MVDAHQEIPNVTERLLQIQEDLHCLMDNDKSLSHSKEVLAMVVAVKNLAYRIDEAQTIIEDFHRNLIETKLEEE